MFRQVIGTAVLIALFNAPFHAAAAEISTTTTTAPRVAPASDEAERALKRFRVPKGFKVELFAAEPLLANPVAFTIDEKGRFFVAETFRLHAGVTDIRQHMGWLDEELASKSVQDRIEMMKRHEGKRIVDYTRESDRVRLVWDHDNDGVADRSTIFADGFNGIEEGLGAGLLARNGTIYYANIPNLWTFRDDDRNGVADSKKALLTGFGVRVGFLGHDLHGLRMGPDGKLYFTVGDRGAHVVTKEGPNERIIENHEEGVVYRCNPDGTELEIFARGMRNPQELAFDAYGNLWTGENNSDGGDPARWVYVVEGGDSGWRIGYQFLNYPNARGVWLAERMCYPQWPGQPAFIIPPIANIGNGPSGLAYYPGTGFSGRYENHFFLSDFRGSTGSGVHSFSVRPRGAGFDVTDRHEFLWECLVTDGDFGYDGAFYVTDWVEGWNKTGKGRIYRISHPEFVKEKAARETRDLFALGFDTLALSRLTDLLSHSDMRVRQEAQFAIVAQGPVTAATTLTNLTRGRADRFAKMHSIWGLGQIATRSQLAVAELNRVLEDDDAEMRAQAAKALGSVGLGERKTFARLLSDENARVRFFAALALAKVGNHETIPPILEMLRANADQDVYLRHAGVMALASAARRADATTAATSVPITETSTDSLKLKKAFAPALSDKSDAVRMAALLALRRVESPDIAQFLQDANPLLVAEAARAINDIPITNALVKLAALIEQEDKLTALSAGDEKSPGPRDAVLRRVVNANYRLGQTNNALALAAFAATSKATQAIREESLTLLGEWGTPSGRDRITGLWRPLPKRSPEVAAAALQPHLIALQQSSSDALKLAATKVAGRLRITGTGLDPIDLVNDQKAAANLRVEALKSMAANKDTKLGEAIRISLADTNEVLRKEATRLQAQMQPGDAVAQLRTTLESGSIGEQQNALATLGAVTNAEADAVLSQWLDKLLAREVKPELHLDLLDAAAKRGSPEIKGKVRKFETARPAADDLRSYRECLVGGDAEEGKKIFLEKVEASCVRCHKLGGEGGEVGPEVTGIGALKDRQYLLESIVFPNKHIAEGFESVVVTLKNETTYAGQLKRETPDILEINSPEDGLIQLKKADIKVRERGLSGMPEELRQVLTKHDLRNLVEFLAQLKEGK